MARAIAASVLALLLVSSTGFVHARIPTSSVIERDADAFVPKPEFAKVAALGFDTVLADFYWLQAVQVVGTANADPTEYGTHLGRLIDVVTTLDPWVDHPYRFAAVWLTGSPEDVEMANKLLHRSLEYHPWEWRNRFYLGYNLFYYLGDDAAAADMLEAASSLHGSPRYLPRLVARLRSQHADIETAEIFLTQLLQDAPDASSRAEYQSALDEIEVEHAARFLERARKAYVQLNGKDIGSVEELVTGRHRVVDRLPPSRPASLPDTLVEPGHGWTLKDGQVVSTYYGHRYRVNLNPSDRKRREEWSPRAEPRRAAAESEEAEGDG